MGITIPNKCNKANCTFDYSQNLCLPNGEDGDGDEDCQDDPNWSHPEDDSITCKTILKVAKNDDEVKDLCTNTKLGLTQVCRASCGQCVAENQPSPTPSPTKTVKGICDVGNWKKCNARDGCKW